MKIVKLYLKNLHQNRICYETNSNIICIASVLVNIFLVSGIFNEINSVQVIFLRN